MTDQKGEEEELELLDVHGQIYKCKRYSDVKRGQNLEAEIETKASRPRPRQVLKTRLSVFQFSYKSKLLGPTLQKHTR